MVLCGGECAEDITEHRCSELDDVKGFEVRADTLLRMQKELATKKETIVSNTGVEHDFNINMGMNKLMVKLAVQTGQLSPKNDDYIFDYDNQFIPADKYDSKLSYKHADGYLPGIASIGNFPVYIEKNKNTVFLVMMAICRNLCHFLTDFISKKLDFIKPTFRLKKFIFRFMVVTSKWITQGQQILKLFSAKKYHLLLG